MSKTFEKWLQNQDDRIKKYVVQIAKEFSLEAKFKGYYFEENDLRGVIDPAPIYKSFKDYHSQVKDTMFIDHVRYFFDLSNSKETRILTVRFFNSSISPISFSIEETYGESKVEDNVTYDNLELIKELIAKKFTS
ncbi:hypothetical protein WH52_09465 [Tenacibaculum holothuriorum]|uniref:Uncharacterized protein n=1 Tax=Tenacibaculum holothuriorum TaxID=1635173 RepID=A0A1Y2PCX9_9FLAO|nr:hypothetical protein [Tenacibaculum holothuriorum]OSY87657.1 hypothetical protein WH52_09465 [Tenacibaculum holothuriorum]